VPYTKTIQASLHKEIRRINTHGTRNHDHFSDGLSMTKPVSMARAAQYHTGRGKKGKKAQSIARRICHVWVGVFCKRDTRALRNNIEG
jgi:hypothetical protein